MTHLQSLIKAISYRALATLSTVAISYLVTGKITYAVTIASFEVVFKILLFYVHERIWGSVANGFRSFTSTQGV